MVLFKFLLFVLLSASLNAKSEKVNFQTGGQWSRVRIGDLPEAEKELRFFQLKDLNEFELELVKDPFDELASFRLVLVHFEFWCKFNQSELLILRLQICDDQYSWPLEFSKKQAALKVFNESYISSKESQSCLSKFNFEILNASNLSSTVEVNELNIHRLAAFYSPVGLPVNGTGDLREAWNVINQETTKRYECKQENCDSFLVNSKTDQRKIKNRKLYPRSNSEWGSFLISERSNETLRIELDEHLKLISGKDYRIELFYFVTENVRLRLFTTASNSSIISLYPTYSYLPGKERLKYLPVSINLKDLLPFNVNALQPGFSVLVRTEVRPTAESRPFDDPPIAAVSNIRITSADFPSQNLTDFLAHWGTDGERASNEWSCLVDQTSFYSGEQSYDGNNISITFFAPKFRSKSTYLLLSKWSIENGQQFEIQVTAETNSTLLIETIGEHLEVLNSQSFELDQWKENALHYDLGGHQGNSIEGIKRVIIRLKLSFILRNDDDQPKKVTISDLNYGDPCSQPDRCLFAKECVSRSSTEYRCECLANYHGKRCEWPDRCATDYCGKQNATCTPIRDSFKCDCADGSFWLNDRRICQQVPYCYSKEHLRDHQCVYEYDYEGNQDCNENQTFGCGQLFEPSSHIDCIGLNHTNSCLENEEKMVISLASSLPNALGSFCVCNRENGFFESRTSQTRCVQPSNQTQIPFLKQLFSCSQTYKFSMLEDPEKNNSSDENRTKNQATCKPECACWKGFALDDKSDGKLDGTPTDCRPTEKCTLTCGPNQFCGIDENGTQTCLCDFGYFDENCKSNFCEAKANEELIQRFCGPFGCRATNFTGQVKFVCNCDERIYESNSTTGLCQMRDVCAPGSRNDLDCQSRQAVCVPSLNNDTIWTYACRCPKGWRKDRLTGHCVQLCSVHDYHELMNQRCFASLALNSTEFLCKPGFVSDGNGFCVLSEREHKYKLSFEARLNVDADVYQHFNQIKNHQLNEADVKNLKIHEDCSTLLDPEGCVALMNRSYLQLEKRSNGMLIEQSFVFAFSRLVSLSLQSVLGDDLFSSQVLHFQVLDDFSGLETRNRATTKSFKVLNFTVYLETNNFFKNLDEHFFFGRCNDSFCPLYPYLKISRRSFQVEKLNLNESDLLTQCLPNSSPCVFMENSNSLFRCECDRGFRRLSKIPLSHKDDAYFKEICVDEDECVQRNDCDPASTVCVNSVGDYRCDCKSGLIRRDNRSCEQANSRCDLRTANAFLLNRELDYECRCKTDTLVKKDDFSCTDPCLEVRCKQGKCLPHRDSYVCAYVGNASSERLSTALLVCVCILSFIRIPGRRTRVN